MDWAVKRTGRHTLSYVLTLSITQPKQNEFQYREPSLICDFSWFYRGVRALSYILWLYILCVFKVDGETCVCARGARAMIRSRLAYATQIEK